MKNRILLLLCLASLQGITQPGTGTKWTPEGDAFLITQKGAILKFDLKSQIYSTVIPADKFIPTGQFKGLEIKNFNFSTDRSMLLVFTNAKKVWRYETRGDYWVLNLENDELQQLAKSLPSASLMFAKFSPDGSKAAYVSNRNIYVEDLTSGKIKQLTKTNGNPGPGLINGTFDWAYEEELACYDGFRWSPDSKKIAYWQLDASGVKYFNLINNTDSIYPKVTPIEYPKVGESPSACRIGVMDVKRGKTKWMNVPGDNRQHYIPRMEWAGSSNEIMLQQLDRKQQVSKIMYANVKTGESETIHEETDKAWVGVRDIWHDDNPAGWEWINDGQDFLWLSEKDGWNHLYKIARDGKSEQLLTRGNYDVIKPLMYDKNTDQVYFTASPDNSMQEYLYRVSVSSPEKAEKISPANQEGSHTYNISAGGTFALHTFQNYYTAPSREWVTLPDHKALDETNGVNSKINPAKKEISNVRFVEIETKSGVKVEGWMALPTNFNPDKKYATVFYVYSEPAKMTSKDTYRAGKNSKYVGNMTDDGYIYISVDGRGSPAPKGREWRKSIYKNIGIINIKDQAEAAQELMKKFSFIDSERIAVHGWSGGGSTTLNLLFKYPDIYQTGISVAAVANQLTYDNIYQERYMGIPQEDMEPFIEGSPMNHVKNFKGNLLYIHGQGDDNVHYQNAEMLINEMVKYNKQFQFMAYPNRTHGIREGEGTTLHLNTMFTKFLKENCPPGARD